LARVESYGRLGITLRPEQIQTFREEAKRKLEDAIRASGKSPADFDIAPIMPKTDLGLTNEEWKHTFSSAYTEENYVSQTLGDNVFLVLYGYTNHNSTPHTLYFELKKNQSVEKVVHVQETFSMDEPYVFFDPVVFSEGDTVTIVLYGNAAADDYPVFLGFIAKPKGHILT